MSIRYVLFLEKYVYPHRCAECALAAQVRLFVFGAQKNIMKWGNNGRETKTGWKLGVDNIETTHPGINIKKDLQPGTR